MNLSLAQNDQVLDNHPVTVNTCRNAATTLSMLTSLAAFEIFNYATTAFAIKSLLGGFAVIGFNLAAWLAVAVCCLDVTGIILLFMPLPGSSRTKSNRRLFTTWLSVTGLNAWLSWLGISQAIAIRQTQTGLGVDVAILTHTLPAFIVCLVWLVRIVLIGSFTNPQSIMNVTDAKKNETIFPEESFDPQTLLPFNLLPHGTENQHAPIFSFTTDSVNIREPTYRGIPVRYKTS